MDENLLNVMQTSDDSRELLKSSMALARSKQPKDHQDLFNFLTSPAFLHRLDTPEEYKNAAAKRLRVSQILQALSINDAPSAHSTYVALTKNSSFLNEEPRVDELIRFSANIRDEAPDLMNFWDKYSQPDDGFVNLTIKALVENGTESAMEVLEKKMADPKHEDGEKIGWMRGIFVPHRDDFQLLKSFERMLTDKLPPRLRPNLVEAIFDYRPGEWYRPATAVNPPDRQKIGSKEREQLHRLANIALQIPDLTEVQKEAVRNTLKDLGYN